MYKLFLVLSLMLFVFPSGKVLGQGALSQKQLPNQTRSPSGTPASAEPNPEAKSFYEEGVSRVEMGQLSEAVERFQQAVRIDPGYAEAYSALGRAFFKLRQWDNASGNLRHAIALKAAKERERPDLPQKSTVSRTNSAGLVAATNAASVKTPAARSENVQPEQQQKSSANSKSALAITNRTLQEVTTVETPPVELLRPEPNPQPTGIAVPQSNTNERALRPKQEPMEVQTAMSVPPSSLSIERKSLVAVSHRLSADEVSLTNTYRVGPKDVLDVRLHGSQSSEATVFTVTESGRLEHPKLSEAVNVTGLTVDEIATRIQDDLKRHAITENPKAVVGVLDYASHTIVVSGLVKNPGTKVLKREALPLVMILAEVQPLPEAARVTVVRKGANQVLEADLNLTAGMNFLVHPGDVVTLHAITTQPFYIGGEVKSPGNKTYRVGITLLQAIIMAGGVTHKSRVAEIGRDDAQGLFVRTRFDLAEIESGKTPDPVLKPGDRILVLR
jgi:protein involved in polysaccharide export with SLBB domain